MRRGQPFQPGNSMGRGRPKGSRNRSTLEREALLEEYGPAILRRCISDAMKGDRSAQRLCVERLLPPAKQQPSSFRMPRIRSLADLASASAAVLAAVASGDLSIQDGEGLQRMLDTHRRLLEDGQLQRRIEMLEQQGRSSSSALDTVVEGEDKANG